MLAIADAFNEEYHELADAGCPVIQIEEPQIHLAGGARHSGQGDHAGIDGRGVRSHREGPARQDRSVGAFLLGQPVAAAHVRQGAELQAVAGDLQQGRRRRDHVRDVKLRRHGPGRDRQDHHREEDRHRRHRPPHAAGRKPGRSGGANPRRAQIHSAGTAGHLVRLRHGPRGHEPPPRLLQDGLARARHQYGAQGAGFPRSANAWPPTSAIRW